VEYVVDVFTWYTDTTVCPQAGLCLDLEAPGVAEVESLGYPFDYRARRWCQMRYIYGKHRCKEINLKLVFVFVIAKLVISRVSMAGMMAAKHCGRFKCIETL
jgi:hypothetical protein